MLFFKGQLNYKLITNKTNIFKTIYLKRYYFTTLYNRIYSKHTYRRFN